LYNELERSKFEALIKVQQNKTYSPIIKNSAGAST
jgi:hypothetical protein